MENTVWADTLSGEGGAVSMGQTQVKAQVVAPSETPSGTSPEIPPVETKVQQVAGTVKSVKSGDASEVTVLFFTFALSGWGILALLIQLIKRRRL